MGNYDECGLTRANSWWSQETGECQIDDRVVTIVTRFTDKSGDMKNCDEEG